MNLPSQAVVAAFGRHVLSYAAGAVTVAAALHVVSPDQANSLSTAITQIVSGVQTAMGGVATVVSVGAGLYAAWTATSRSRIAAINTADNGVKVVAATAPAPAVDAPLK